MPQGTRYGRLTSDTDYRLGTEYGGVDNIIQPPPHTVNDKPNEMLMQMYQTNPSANFPAGSNLDDQPIPQTQAVSPLK